MIRYMMSPCIIASLFLLIVLYFTYEPGSLPFLGGNKPDDTDNTTYTIEDELDAAISEPDPPPPIPPSKNPIDIGMNNAMDLEFDKIDGYNDIPDEGMIDKNGNRIEKKDGMISRDEYKRHMLGLEMTSQLGGIIDEEDEEISVENIKVDRASSVGLEPYDYNSGFAEYKI